VRVHEVGEDREAEVSACRVAGENDLG
jgi:hypothetical protein